MNKNAFEKGKVNQVNYTTATVNRKFYTPEEVRQVIFADTISKPLLYASIRRGDIPSMRLGPRKILVPAWWVDRILAMPEPEGDKK